MMLLLALLLAVMCLDACSDAGKDKIIGKWVCELYGSDLVIEFSEDGSFIDHTSGSINKYFVSDGKIVTYVEGVPESEIAIDFEVKDGLLIYGKTEYKKYEDVMPYDKNDK